MFLSLILAMVSIFLTKKFTGLKFRIKMAGIITDENFLVNTKDNLQYLKWNPSLVIRLLLSLNVINYSYFV